MSKKHKHIENEIFLADWMAGKITDEELKSLVSPSDFKTYKKILVGMDAFEKPSFDSKKGFESISNRIQNNKDTKVRSLIPSWLYAVAAFLVLFFGISQFLPSDNLFSTDFSAQKNITFQDGSIAYLNANSQLKYAKNWDKKRSVNLEGEAFFEVKKGKQFSVKTPQGLVQVLGTKFNIISRTNFFEVICYEGKVSILSGKHKNVLTAGQAWRIIKDHPVELWNLDTLRPTWLEGESSFKSVPIPFVLEAIENQFKVKLQTAKIDKNILFTGSFSHQDIDTALQAICLPLNLEYKIVDNQTIVLSKK